MSVRYTTQLPRIKRSLRPRVQEALQTAVHEIEAEAKMAAPIDTGYLRSSISSEVSGMEGRVQVAAEYGVFVEFGTRYMAAQPFLTPAFEAGSQRLMAEIRNVFR